MDNPLMVEIIAYAPTAFYHCMHCEVAWRELGVSNQFHQEQVRSSLPPDLAQDYQQVSDWVREVFLRYDDRVVVKVIDAASPEGVWKSLRYGMRRYPAVIVDRKLRFSNDEFQAASEEIGRILGAPQGGMNRERVQKKEVT